MTTSTMLVPFLIILSVPPEAALRQQHGVAPAAASPYAGEQGRDIKALSEADVKAYVEGAGMGMAKPAELNQYPGPRHVLELSAELKLSDAQRAAVDASHQRMKSAAVTLGRQVVDVERRLDGVFARREASAEAVERLASEGALLQGRLRAIHLRAHVEVRDVLTPEQVELYVRLRGYGHPGH